MRFLPLSALLLVTACGGSHDHAAAETATATVAEARTATPDAFRTQLEEQVGIYLMVKDALAGDDAATAASHAGHLVMSLEGWTPEGLSPAADSIFAAGRTRAIEAAKALADLDELDEQRIPFDTVSQVFIGWVEEFGPLATAYYRQTCPMVRGGSADWISKEEAIRNPYHGARMLECGEVVRSL